MKPRRNRRIAATVASLTLLTACADPGALRPGVQPLDAGTLGAKESLAGHAGNTDAWPKPDWWAVYGDAQLDRLIEEAIAGNPTLAAARARIGQADAVAAAAAAAERPWLSAATSAERQRYSEHGLFPPPIAGATMTSGQLGLNFSYEFDFWGRQSAALESALSRARAAAIEGDAARLALAAAVARGYVELDHQFALRNVAVASLKQREQIRDLTDARVHAGLESKVELRQAAGTVFSARADIAAADERIVLVRDELAALLGQGPDRGLAIERPHVSFGADLALPTHLPAELLGRRPDVAAQRQRVEAAASDIASAKARFYPNVDLTAMLGMQSVGLDQLLKGGSRVFDIGAALSLPLFDGGRLRANLAGRDADYALAVQQYNGTLVDALRDVADQVNGWRAIDLQNAEQSQAQAEAEEAYRLALLRYKEGLSSYLTVLSVETQVLTEQRRGADLRARRLSAAIGLARALGGGYGSTALAAAR